jgi:DNA-binding transcriptional regulator PaaX
MQIHRGNPFDFFFWGLEVFSRRDCGLILCGLRQCASQRQANTILARWEARQWISHQGKGTHARFRITATGAQQGASIDVARYWDARWDGKWRIFTYDLPETRRTERVLLWRELHARKFGLLQRSVWVWPHSVEAILQEVLQAAGVPECFCGFDCPRLFLCTGLELVSASWDFARINESQQAYMKTANWCFDRMESAPDLQRLAHAANLERSAYLQAFLRDPLLPRCLWPNSYNGPQVESLHRQFQLRLQSRLRDLADECR